jgi:hypothetical protein
VAIQPGTSALLEPVVELEYLVLVPPGEQLQQAGNTLVIERARPKPSRLNASCAWAAGGAAWAAGGATCAALPGSSRANRPEL